MYQLLIYQLNSQTRSGTLPDWRRANLGDISRFRVLGPSFVSFRTLPAGRPSGDIRNTYSPTVHHGGSLFGFNGSFLVCVDPSTGVPRWRERVYGGSLIVAGEHLVILGESSGELRVADASADGYRERLRVPVFNAGASSVTTPVVVGNRVYLRNLEEMVALEIGG